MWAGKYDAVEETLNPLYDQMSNHVMIQRKRLGGDMAIAQAVFSRRQRDKLRKIIGPDLVFIVLNMTKECQMKRIKGRHGDSNMLEEFMRVLMKYAEMCEPAGDDEENAFNVTISEDMSKDDVVKKVLEIVNNLDKKARILLQIIICNSMTLLLEMRNKEFTSDKPFYLLQFEIIFNALRLSLKIKIVQGVS